LRDAPEPFRHRQAGDAVTVAVATDGESQAAGSPRRDERDSRREAEAVAARLGVGLHWLGLPEGEWSAEALREGLGAVLEQSAPAIVYAPSAVDFHPEHVAVARSLAAVLGAASSVRIRVYPAQVPSSFS
jgi:LmbE family N-acetylglucosaminyl deacetylase